MARVNTLDAIAIHMLAVCASKCLSAVLELPTACEVVVFRQPLNESDQF